MLFNNIKKEYILDAVNTILPHKRTPKHSNEYLLDQFCTVLNTVTSWNSYKTILRTHTDKSYNHYKYLNNKYREWAKHDVFKIAYMNMLNDNYKLPVKDNNLTLNVDVTCISNMYGIENIGLNPEYTKKNVTKICFLNDENNIPISVIPIDIKEQHTNYTTLSHDVTSLNKINDELLINIDDNINININGDKGFITSTPISINNNNVNLCVPKRIKSIKQVKKEIKKTKNEILKRELKITQSYTVNRKNNHINAKKELLLKCNSLTNTLKSLTNTESNMKKTSRYLIENFFSKIKKFNRIRVRMDKLLITYMNFIFMALLVIF
jgi:hypothetical protein